MKFIFRIFYKILLINTFKRIYYKYFIKNSSKYYKFKYIRYLEFKYIINILLITVFEK